MQPSDLEAVLRVQAACYPPSMQEAAAVVLGRMRAASASCVVACDPDGVCGYLFAYPSRQGLVTDLDAPFEIAVDADTLYLHDLAVDPRALGRGLARTLVETVLALARTQGLAHSALVSVQDSARFWSARGYRATACADPGLLSYPDGAVYMVRTPA
jgi:GNAT superfamily N-acetyltransferase